MRQLILYGLLGLSLAVNAAVAGAWVVAGLAAGDNNGTPSPGCPIPQMELTPSERAAVEPIRERFREERLAHRSRFLQMRARLAPLVISDEPDREALDTLLREMSEAQAALQRTVVERVLAVRAALGPAHRARYDEMIVPHIQAGDAMRCDCDCPETR